MGHSGVRTLFEKYSKFIKENDHKEAEKLSDFFFNSNKIVRKLSEFNFDNL
ncbi:hypothetical protein [Deferribacter autotrophicus]|uniref:hypothetical protein n=1 Tax=Deferribacter autotrophicus TaxID=500465 RepID=UPI00165E79B2|nr:hypothetical protein [Deferribacter autotrophicus]